MWCKIIFLHTASLENEMLKILLCCTVSSQLLYIAYSMNNFFLEKISWNYFPHTHISVWNDVSWWQLVYFIIPNVIYYQWYPILYSTWALPDLKIMFVETSLLTFHWTSLLIWLQVHSLLVGLVHKDVNWIKLIK